ncbi:MULTISPECIES: DUF6510 family protein [unclassified Curtobacterium]|uniref:DUF6510 family protein n=1 Tax=unclassified Curtobacterium TaxID=257496 RepID=UPI0015E8A7EC|nr:MULTISPECIES: DUF6510 family protein [unclassified Curtobacterium]
MTTRLDGNAAAGVLADVFGTDTTTARVRCSGCGAVGVVATVVVLADAAGTVLRCPECDDVLATVVDDGATAWLSMPGVSAIGIPRPVPLGSRARARPGG